MTSRPFCNPTWTESCRVPPKEKFAELQPKNNAVALQRMMAKLLEVNTCPDFIEDRGHTYGRDISDQDKRALIEYVKYF